MTLFYTVCFGVLRFRSSAFVSAQADLRARLMKGCLVLRSVFSVLCSAFCVQRFVLAIRVRKPATRNLLITAHCSLLTAHCSLLTAHCSLPSIYLLFSTINLSSDSII